MADDNDKSPLTRRRVLGGMATIGAAGAVGAGSWAAFSDEETANVTASGGTLDLKVEDQDITGHQVSIGPVVPNGSKDIRTVTLKNTGTVPGNLGIDITKSGDSENSDSSGEYTDGDSNGELDDHLDFTIDVKNGRTNTAGVNQLAGVNFDNGPKLGPGKSQNVTFSYSVDDAGNEIQGDSVTLDVAFTLDQA